MEDEPSIDRGEILGLTAEIVAAHVANHAVSERDLPSFIEGVFSKLAVLAAGTETANASTELVPAVPIRRSVTDAYIVCLEDGKKLKMLKRHLRATHGMTPQQYRAKWGLKPDYPMVAPAYAETRTALAIKFGLGRKPAPPTPAPKPKRPRSKPTAA